MSDTLRLSRSPLPKVIDIQASANQGPRMLYDRKAAAHELCISVRSVDALIKRRELETRRIGKRVLIPHAALVKYARADHFGPIQCSPDYLKVAV